MLVTQLNFQVQHTLSDAIEPELTGLDNAGMYRPHRHLMDFIAFHGIVIVAAGDVLAVIVSEDIRSAEVVGVIAHHLQPGMPLGPNSELFCNLAFKHMEGFAPQRQRRIGLRRIASGHQQYIGPEHRQQFDR